MANTPPFLSWLAHLFQVPEEMDELRIQLMRMEHKMAKYEEEIAGLRSALSDVAAKVAELRDMINTDDPAVEAQLRDIEAGLRGAIADPVPPVEPTPEP